MKRRGLFAPIILISLIMIGCANQIGESGSIVVSLPYGSARAADDISYTYVLDFVFADSTTVHDEKQSGEKIVYDNLAVGDSSVSVKVYDLEKTKLIYSGQTDFYVSPGRTVPVSIAVKKVAYNSLKWKTSDYISFNNPDWSLLTVQRFLDEDVIDSDYVKAEDLFNIYFADTILKDVNYAGYLPVVLESKDKAFTATVSIPMCLNLSEITKDCLSVKFEQKKNTYTVTNTDVKIIFIDDNKAEHELAVSFDVAYEWYVNDKKIEGENTSTYTVSPKNTATVQCKAILTPIIKEDVKTLLGELTLFDEETVTLASERMTFTPYKGEVDDYDDNTKGYHFTVEYPVSEYELPFSFYNSDFCRNYQLNITQYKDEGQEVSPIKDVVFYFDGEKIIPDEEPSVTNDLYSINYVYNFGKYSQNSESAKDYMGTLTNDEQEKFTKLVNLINQYGHHEIICYITLEDGTKVTLSCNCTKFFD